jgi:multiple sugar transport system ATP-binding protein
MAEIQLDNVTKRFPDGALAVDNISLDIADGEFVILVGPSGCGKSTTLNMIAGLEDITEGELRIGGKVVNNAAPKDRDIAMVFQSYALYPHMTVRENMGFALKLAKRPQKEIDEKVGEAARVLDLTEHLDRRPANLSGGQRQRVAMGRAIVRDPAAFLMDEPLSNLDAKLRVQTRTVLSRLQRRLGTTTVYVTHDQTEAMTLGDRVAVMRAGLLQQVGAPQELYDRPNNLFVAGFIGSPAMNFLPSHIDDDTLRTPLGDVPLTGRLRRALERADAPRDLLVGVRPENFEDASLVPPEARDSGIPFRADIEVVESMGSDVFVYFTKEFVSEVNAAELQELAEDAGTTDTGATNSGMITARLGPETRAREGQETELWVDLRSMHIFNPASGANITLEDDADSAVRGGATASTTADTPRDTGGPDAPADPAGPAGPAESDAPAGPGTGAA